MDYNWKEFEKLNETEKRNIFNHIWDPYNPEIGYKTKLIIVEKFIECSNIPAIQFGIKSFGWNVYMIYVIVDNSKIRVPKNFASLPVNKGIISRKIDTEKSIVKFNYGGEMEVSLNEKIIVR